MSVQVISTLARGARVRM